MREEDGAESALDGVGMCFKKERNDDLNVEVFREEILDPLLVYCLCMCARLFKLGLRHCGTPMNA